MKIKPYFEKLENSSEYKDFKTKYPDSFLMAGFFVLDLEQNNNIHQIDFYMPAQKKVAAFSLDDKIELKILDVLKSSKVPEKLEAETNTDLDELKGILLDEMHNRGMSEDIKKIIAVLQKIDGDKVWIVNCVLSGMEVLKSHIEDSSKTVLKIEKVSLMDMMKKMPMQKMMKKPESKEEAEKAIAKLDKLEEQLEKEKEKLKKEIGKKEKKSEVGVKSKKEED